MVGAKINIFGREPAAWLALVAVVVKLVSAFVIEVSPDQQTVINAVAAAAMGLFIAVLVHDGVIAAVLGLAQAAVALAVGFGLDWSVDQQALVMSFIALIVAGYERTQVTAPVPPIAGPGVVVGPREL